MLAAAASSSAASASSKRSSWSRATPTTPRPVSVENGARTSAFAPTDSRFGPWKSCGTSMLRSSMPWAGRRSASSGRSPYAPTMPGPWSSTWASTNAISDSNASQSSAVTSSPSSASVAARLTSVTICARRAASTKRRLSSARPSVWGAEGSDDHTVVSIPLRATDPADLATRIRPGDTRNGIAERRGNGIQLALGERVAEPGTAGGAVEDERGVNGLAQLGDRVFDRCAGAQDDRLGALVADLDGRVALDARRADQGAVGGSGPDVPRADGSAELRLCERVHHRQGLELVVAELSAVHPKFLEVDVRRRPPVQLDDVRAVRAGDDRRGSPRYAAVRDPDADRRAAADRHCDDAVQQCASPGEPGARGPPGGPAGERNRAARDRVRPGDDLGLVARLRVDEQQHDPMGSAVDSRDGLCRRLAPRRPRVAALRGADARLQRHGERDRRAAGVHQTGRADGGRSRHAGDGGAARGFPSLGGDGVGIRVGGREDEHQPGLTPELADRAFHGVGAGPCACSRCRAGHAFADVGFGCWGHAARCETKGYRNYRRFQGLRNQRAAYPVTSVCGPNAS